MGYAKGKNDITGIVWLAMFGSLYEITIRIWKMRRKQKENKEGQVSLLLLREAILKQVEDFARSTERFQVGSEKH